MKTVVLSDTAIIGSDIVDLEEGYKLLNILQHKGINVVWLSNCPLNYMHEIGVKVDKDGKTEYEFLGPKVFRKHDGLSIISHGDGVQLVSRTLRPTYTIFGNGIGTLDFEGELIRQEEFLKKSTVNGMIDVFKEHGYKSIRWLDKNLGLGDRRLQNGDDAYKFFTPENGVAEPTNRVYGMQCSSRGSENDFNLMNELCYKVKGIRAYRLNNKPCFYNENVNKLVALNKLLDHEDLNIDDCVLILNELTDDVLARQYPNITEKVRGELYPEETKTLAKVLKEIS